jgi:hypothetical protein
VYLPKVRELQFLNAGMRSAPGTQDQEAYFSKLVSLHFVDKGFHGFEPLLGAIGPGTSWASVNAILPSGGFPITWLDILGDY